MSAAVDLYERKPRNAGETTAFVDWRMYQWARFARDRLSELGFPKESVSTKLLREIVLGINSPSGYCPDESWPQEVGAVERCVTRLCRGRQAWVDLIEVTYLTPREEPNEARARRMRVSERRYKELLARFRTAMYGALLMEDDEKKKSA